MSVVDLDFYAPDGTTLLGTLSDDQLIECESRPAFQELGALRFVVSRHLAEAESAMLAKGNIVKVTYPVIDPEPICVFVLKDDASQLIDDAEEGGEHLEVTGPGALWILQHARLREEVYAPEQPTRGDWDDDLSWNWRNRPYGGILVRCIEEGQYQPGNPLAAISIDFDRTVDSDGIPWANIAEDFSVQIGTDVLTVADRIAAAGDLFLVLTPDMVLHAYQTYGRDLTGAFGAATVRFEKGVNVLTELQRKTKLDRVTHLITRDMEQVYRTYETPDPYEQAVYGFLEIGWTNDEPQIEKTALNVLATSTDAAELYVVESLPGVSPEQGEYLPGPEGTDGHFWPGDEATLHTGSGEHDLDEADVRVVAVSIVLDQAADDSDTERSARSLHIVPELVVGTPGPSFSGVGDGPGSGGVGCPCLKLCQPLTGIAPVPSEVFGLPDSTVPNTTIPSGTGALYAAALFLASAVEPFTAEWDAGTPQAMTEVERVSLGIHGTLLMYRLLAPTPGFGDLSIREASVGGEAWKGYWVIPGLVSGQVVADNSGSTQTTSCPVVGSGLSIWVAARRLFDNDAAPTVGPGQVIGTGWQNSGVGSGWIGGYGSHSPTVTWANTDESWGAITVLVQGVASVGDGHSALIGDGKRVKRCSDTEHYPTIGEPTVDDDETIGMRPGTLWVDVNTGRAWLLLDATAGAAEWLAVSGGLTEAEVNALIAAAVTDFVTAAEVATLIEAQRWEAVTDGEDVFVWENDDLVHEWKAY